ncbi:hypothetical protein [Pontibacter beigongshangensis]|uniref:hypothetical protein n=1 Tax=Pontibacter beigongshangensis TaxID=2574733 RepID=UPI00164F9B59|nr:hypothetical protein [Pontibacter beigongshangensis]
MIQVIIISGCVITFLVMVGVWVWLIFYDKQEKPAGKPVSWYTRQGEEIQWKIFANENYGEEEIGEERGKKVM